MKRIFQVSKFLLKFDRKVFFKLIFVSINLSLIELAIASIIIQLFNQDQSGFIEKIGTLSVIAITLFLQVTAILFFWYLIKQIMVFTYDISSLVFNNFLKKPLTYFEANKDSGMNNDVYNETNRLALNIFIPFIEIVSKSVILISISSLLFYNYGFIAIILFLGLLLTYVIIGTMVRKKLKSIGVSVSYYNEERLKTINEAIRNILELKANNYTEYISDKYTYINKQFSVVQTRNQFLIKFPKYILEIVLVISICLLFIFSGTETLFKYLSLGVISLKLIPQFQTLYQNWGQFNTHFIAYENVSEFLEKRQVKNRSTSGIFSLNSIQVLPIKNWYTSKGYFNSELIFQNGTNAFLGDSGTGKTTIMKSIMGLYEHANKCIMYDNISLADLNTNYIRNEIEYVSQKVNFYEPDINKFLGIDIRDSKAKLVISDLGLTHHIKNNQILESNGKALSGGERQRLALAKVILSSKRLILLDEAMIGLGLNFIDVVFKYINEKNAITIIISHNQSVISKCNRHVWIR